jgi:signal transduction histidine kinase
MPRPDLAALAPRSAPAPESPSTNGHRRAEDLYSEIAQLAGGLAHEIRNPLSTMRLNLDLLAEDFRASEGERERRSLVKIERIQKESHRLEGMLDDFLRYVRVGNHQTAPVDFNALIDEVRDFCEPQSLAQGIFTRVQFHPEVSKVRLHTDTFKQALLNLIRNAQQAMPDGGEIMLRTRPEGDRVALDVIDTGKGIPAEVQPRIFEPFYSTRPRGTGLGLPTTRRIIEAAGGEIVVSSEPGRGSQFTVLLPAAETSA